MRWAIEPSFRDITNLRFGMEISSMQLSSHERCERLFPLNTFAFVLLTLLAAAGESLGYDRHLKANTVKRRTPSL